MTNREKINDMKKYNHVNELAWELEVEGFLKDKDITIPADSDPEESCLHDQYGNTLYSYPKYKTYYIFLVKK